MNGWVNNREAGDLGRLRAHYVVTVMHTTTALYIFVQIINHIYSADNCKQQLNISYNFSAY